jgi:UDP-2,4-diacetamido-2,4,6-trideoxy-beta-L-altropyranose hydrolase
VDSYSAELDLLAQVARRAGAVLYLDDTLRLPYPAGLAVNSTPGDLGALPGKAEWLSGPKWHPVRPAFAQVGPRGPVSRDVQRLLILSGGADLHGFSHVARRAARAAFPDADLHVVAGPGAKGYDETLDDPSLIVHRTLEAAAMRDLMLGSDLAVSAAGQTLYELALCGCPTASVGLADNQAHNLREWDRLGAAVAVGWHTEPNLEARLTDVLLGLAPAERRRGMSHAGQTSIDGRGTERLLGVLAGRLGLVR